MSTTDALIPTKEAASLLGESVRQFIRRVEREEITPVFKGEGLRGAYVFNRADIDALRTAAADEPSGSAA